MNEVVYGIGGGLSAEMIRRIHESALTVIERVGLSVPHAGIRGLLAEHSGVRIAGDVVKFQPFLVERAIKQIQYPESAWQMRWGIVSGAYEMNVLDMETGQPRPSKLTDLRELPAALGLSF